MQIYANIVYRPTSNIQTLHLVFITKRARGKLQTLSANRAVCFIFLHLLLLFFLISLSSHPSPSPARLHRLHHRHLLLLLRLLLLEFIFLINNHSKKEKEHDKKRERERERERGRERERERRNWFNESSSGAGDALYRISKSFFSSTTSAQSVFVRSSRKYSLQASIDSRLICCFHHCQSNRK